MKIKIITSIEPNKKNKYGPSGLLWECIELLKEKGVEYEIELKKSTIFNKLGIYLKKYNKSDSSSLILVYPFNAFFYLSNDIRKKAIVIGPDSPSLLYERFYKNSYDLKTKIKNLFLKYWFIYKERQLLKNINKFLVVGKNDARWMKKAHNFAKHKVFYLTHPILQSVIKDKYNCLNTKYNNKTLIFAGDMSKKYTYRHINNFCNIILQKIDIDILIVGKNNKWIYDLFLSKSNKKNVFYIEWIESYAEICNPKYHIHFVPLNSGAGTKNRTLSACALGVTIISTPVGLENISYGKPVNKILKFREVKEILDIDLKSLLNENIVNTDVYIDNVNSRFKSEFFRGIGIEQ